ncbi:hypothetical protein FAGKG844_130029 [Frankia sp. AgKG'84/4]
MATSLLLNHLFGSSDLGFAGALALGMTVYALFYLALFRRPGRNVAGPQRQPATGAAQPPH